MIIETGTLLGIIDTLKEARAALTPDAMNGDKTAGKAREYVFDVIDVLTAWEEWEIGKKDIDRVCSKLKRAQKILNSPDAEYIAHTDEAAECIDKAIDALENVAN